MANSSAPGAKSSKTRPVGSFFTQHYTGPIERYEIADELDVSVVAVQHLLLQYLRAAGRAFDDEAEELTNFVAPFLGASRATWHNEWDSASAPWTGGIKTLDPADVGETRGADDDAGAVTVRTSLSMLKHENRVQGSVELYYDHPDPRECESIEELLSINLRVPNSNYRETQESFVETCEAFAAYYGEKPET